MTETEFNRKKYSKYQKRCEPRPCSVCGQIFTPEHGNKRICPECSEVVFNNKGRHLPRQYETPEDLEQYEAAVRKRYMSRYKDTIVAIGYADRQKADSLRRAGKVRTEL